jgi:hypothetical protein
LLFWTLENGGKVNRMSKIETVDYSPEKAGVGGSIPSLATMFSTAYKAPFRHFHSISFQNFRPVEICPRQNGAVWKTVLRGRMPFRRFSEQGDFSATLFSGCSICFMLDM